ncbi:MAG: hypothetical protein ACREE7_12530, partial [Dongiaceae bacterium]
MAIKPEDFARIYDRFQAAISRYDCGRKCAPLNGGEPVCCSTGHAVPLVQKAEWRLLKSRSDLWHKFKPYDSATRKIVDELHHSCTAIECKGVRHCERDNRSLACRAFPFFPYITHEGSFVGLAYYWDFEDRCWVISNMNVVDAEFVGEFVAAHEMLFVADPEEFDTFKQHSASMRRVFSRRGAAIPLIGRDGGYFNVLPKSGKIVPADPATLPK